MIFEYTKQLSSQMPLTIGCIVEDVNYGYRGIVQKIHNHFFDMTELDVTKYNLVDIIFNGEYTGQECDFFTMNKIDWLKAQKIPHTFNQVMNEKWYSVLDFYGGSSLYPESRLKIISSNLN